MIYLHEAISMFERAGFSAQAVATAEKLMNQGYSLGDGQPEKIVMRRPTLLTTDEDVWHFGIVAVEIDAQGGYWGVWCPVSDHKDLNL